MESRTEVGTGNEDDNSKKTTSKARTLGRWLRNCAALCAAAVVGLTAGTVISNTASGDQASAATAPPEFCDQFGEASTLLPPEALASTGFRYDMDQIAATAPDSIKNLAVVTSQLQSMRSLYVKDALTAGTYDDFESPSVFFESDEATQWYAAQVAADSSLPPTPTEAVAQMVIFFQDGCPATSGHDHDDDYDDDHQHDDDDYDDDHQHDDDDE